mgnify:CR=1 FL=1
MTRPRVVILGGGFAGLACALALPASAADVVLVDRRSAFEFLPAIHELLSGLKAPAALRLPYPELLGGRGHRFRRGEVRAVDAVRRRVALARGALRYDYLVLALGAADADFGVAGVREHALGFKSVAQCAAIGRRLRALAAADAPARVTVVGAGLEGVEALGEILRRYRHSRLAVTVVEARERLLPGAPTAAGERLAAHCAAWGVRRVHGDRVARITARTLQLDSGRRLRSDLTIWTGGPAPQPLYAGSGLAGDGEWVPATPRLLHPAHARVYLAGDAAACVPAIAKQAYHAMDMGRHCARDLLRRERGRRRSPYRPAAKPQLIAFGDLDGLLVQGERVFAGAALGLGKEAVYQAVMARFDRRGGIARFAGLARRGCQAAGHVPWPLPSLRALPARLRLHRLA